MRILLADDHVGVRQGLRKVLEERPEWEVVGEASNGRAAVSEAMRLTPDVAVIDVTMPLLSGIEAMREIARRVPTTRVLAISMHAHEAYVSQTIRAGALGYVLKDSADVELVHAVEAVFKGQSFFSSAVIRARR
jgi:two-component system response regulator NreC